MNKELTAMQLLIEEIDHKLDTEISDTLRYSLEECQKTAKHLLDKEQEQIERAFDRGYFNGVACTGRNGSYDYQSKYGGQDVDR